MNGRYEHQKDDRKEREYKNDESLQHEQRDEKRPKTSHRVWYAVIGVVLLAITVVSVIASVVKIWSITW